MPLLAHFFCGCPRGLFSILANFAESAGSFSGLHVLAADEIVSDWGDILVLSLGASSLT
jgi:hypothetical protein